MPEGKIFISYSKKDSDLAQKLADDLEAAGFRIWIDRSIGGGDLWRETIENNLRNAEEVVIVVSPNSMASKWVQHEGSLAYGWGKKLYPILVAPTDSLPPWLDEYQYIDFAILFGSYATDNTNFLSDIDIGIHTNREISLIELGEINSRIETLLSTEADIILLNDLYKKNPALSFFV